MCGIVGMCYSKDGASVEEWTPSDMAQMMIPGSVHRGPHAWGWMSYSGQDAIDVFKCVGRSDTKRAIKSMEVDPESHWWIGHVRYFTHGDPSNLLNDHPITHGNITGVHNGVIHNYQEVLDITGRHKHNNDEEAEVDSESIFAAINKWGHKKGLDKIRGDMVAAYVDHRYPEVIRLARTVGRPLWIATTPTGALIFASEPQIITNTGIECSEPSQLMTHRILTVKFGKITKRQNLDAAIKTQVSQQSRVSVTPTTRFDPFGIKGVTDRMTPPTTRSANMSSWRRDHYNDRTPPAMPPALPPGTRQTPARSPLGRKAKALREQILERTAAENPNSTPRQNPMRRIPSQAYKRQEDGVYNVEHGLYWQDGVLVDINTYIDNMLGTETSDEQKETA